MTRENSDHETEPQAGTTIIPSGDILTAVEPSYRHVLRVRQLLGWLPLLVGALVLDILVAAALDLRGLPTGIVLVLGLFLVTMLPGRKYRRLGYSLIDGTLRVARGFLFHVDTVVPFSRVQHIDVARGPVERIFGIATLVVHTAGTHNSIVTLPGLAPRTAERIRDDIRAAIGVEPQ